MRRIAGLLCLVFITAACDLNETVTSQVSDNLLPYFPNAKVLTSGATIIGLSCAQGVGDSLVEQVRQMLPQMQGIGALRTLRNVGAVKYQYLAIGFPRSMIRYQIGTGIIDTVLPGAAYENAYRRDCGIADTEPGSYAYVGMWQVEYTTQDGATKTLSWYDTLGVYKDENKAAQHQEAEAMSRIPLIEATMRERGGTLTGATLLKVVRVPVARNAFAE
jgi:hypothetical protein